MEEKEEREAEGPDVMVSIDGEFTGPIPPLYSMVSFGAVAYTPTGQEISRFKANLSELPGSGRHEAAMLWWAQHPEAWEAATKDPLPPKEGMEKFAAWLKSLGGKPCLMGWPLPIDFLFIYWYYIRFLRAIPPFGRGGLDIKSYAAGKMGLNFGDASRTVKRDLGWMGLEPHGLEHDPVNDAERQGRLFFAISQKT